MSHSSQRRPPVRNHTKDSVPNLINGVLHPKSVVAQLVQQGVTHYVTLPDSETANMYEALIAEPSIKIVPVAREGEAIPVAVGLFVAGQRLSPFKTRACSRPATPSGGWPWVSGSRS